MVYKIAEKFRSLQGEGVYAGTPMAFIRFCGCSVGKTICQHCDTDFDTTMPWRGGGEFTVEQLARWAHPYDHICFTGGEPLDQDLEPFFDFQREKPKLIAPMFHIETSGTKPIPFPEGSTWVCVSPKPGFLEEVVLAADEVKVIVPGLGTTIPIRKDATSAQLMEDSINPRRWPTLSDALRWADAGKIVFLQPRNAKNEIDKQNLMYVLDTLRDYPQLRLSSQLHKILRVQ